jgi:hypothetical protein
MPFAVPDLLFLNLVRLAIVHWRTGSPMRAALALRVLWQCPPS